MGKFEFEKRLDEALKLKPVKSKTKGTSIGAPKEPKRVPQVPRSYFRRTNAPSEP
jgi:hypothetical protein